MSGICGICTRDGGAPAGGGGIDGMVAALDPGSRGEGGESVSLAGAALGALPGAVDSARIVSRQDGDAPIAVALCGELVGPCGGAAADIDGDALVELVREGLDDVEGLLARLDGDFVIAIWNGRDRELVVATDRFRTLPIYYHEGPAGVSFSSRLAALRASPLPVDLAVDPRAVIDVAGASVIPTPRSVYTGVGKLPPGHLLRCRAGRCEVREYWDIDFSHPSAASPGELSRLVKEAFDEALRLRFRQDGDPSAIGAFLSGGVDSSTVAGLLSRIRGEGIKTFSIGFGERSFNEIDFARIAAGAFGCDHHEYFVTPEDTRAAVDVIMEQFDEPFANASAVPTYYCARLGLEHGARFLYAGDGGDELFAGNERYSAMRIFDYYHMIPSWLAGGVVRPLVGFLADTFRWKLFVLGKKYIRRASIPYPERFYSYAILKTIPPAEIFEPGFLEAVGSGYNPYEAYDRHYAAARAGTDLDRQLYVDLKLAISDNDIFKVKQMTSAAGVRVRFPFLDRRLADVAAVIPAAVKMRGRELRSFFKKTYADLLPVEIRTKTKHGFGLPIPVWLRTDPGLNELMNDLLRSQKARERGYFRSGVVDDLIEKHREDTTSFYGTLLWNLMILELWHRKYVD